MTLGSHGTLKSGKGKTFFKEQVHHSSICIVVSQTLTKKRKGAVSGAMGPVIGPFSGREKTYFNLCRTREAALAMTFGYHETLKSGKGEILFQRAKLRFITFHSEA